MSKLTKSSVQKFLQDVKDNSSVEILEEGSKQKKDLITSAKKRGILVEGSRDLGVLKTIFLYTDVANSNGAIVPSDEFKKVFPSIIGKQMNLGHDREKVIGFYIDYSYKEKENKAITYAVFFKSNFPDLWKKTKKFQKAGKLSSSFEIWHKGIKTEGHKDSEYTLQGIELSGGALIIEENGELPAFLDAKCLAISKKELEEIVDKRCLCFASKKKDGEIITSAIETTTVEKTDKPVSATPEKIEEVKETAPITKEEETHIQPTVIKTKCSNCSEEFEISGYDTNIKCPKCFAIVNQNGTMIYPPQIKDFKLLCSSCKVDSWLILSNKEDTSKIRCLNCAKEYDITFKKAKSTEEQEALAKLTFLYTGTVQCIQCGNSWVFEGSSKQKQRECKCSKCGLTFTYDITKTKQNRIIASIKEMEVKTKEELNKSKKEGGKTMELDKKEVKKATEEKKVETVAKEKPKAEVKEEKVEVKTTKKPAKEPSKETAPKAEEKVEAKPTKETPKEEVKEEIKPEPKIEEKVVVEKPKAKVKKEDTILADMEYEAELKKKEDVNELTISKVVRFAKLDDKISNLEIAKTKDKTVKKLTSEERKSLSDNEYAVVVTIKNKKTGKERKVRRFPINDKAHIRSALDKLSQPETIDTLKKLGADIKSIRGKIIAQAKNIVKTSLIKRRKDEKVNAEKKIKTLTKQLEDAKKQVELYAKDAKTIITRREELGEYANDTTDEDILNDDKFELAKLEREKSLQTASAVKEDDIIGGAKKDDDYYAKKRKEIDGYAFKRNNKKE